MQNIKLKHTNPETEKYNLKPKKIYENKQLVFESLLIHVQESTEQESTWTCPWNIFLR